MVEQIYYDCTNIMNKLDINNKKPEIYIICGNRSAGKTISVLNHIIKKYILKNKKFIYIYRYNYELDDCANKIFKDVCNIYYNDFKYESKSKMKNIYHELYINDKSVGYAISINSADQLKKNSHLFTDAEIMMFDEFQSESNHYCNNELQKFISIHTSFARGNGEQCRYLPVVMISNTVSLINPYFVGLGISSRLKNNTKFLKGDGFILEVTQNESAGIQQKQSAFNRAFSRNLYIQYSINNLYLNDNASFIEKMQGKSYYLCTIKVGLNEYAIREYTESGIVYCDKRIDKTFKQRICVTTDSHEINYVMLNRNTYIISTLRYYFEKGCFRFADLECKNAVLKLLAY